MEQTLAAFMKVDPAKVDARFEREDVAAHPRPKK
jgi:hypothetical protein